MHRTRLGHILIRSCSVRCWRDSDAFCQRSLRPDKINQHTQRSTCPWAPGVRIFMNMTVLDIHKVQWMPATPAWAQAAGKEVRRRRLCPTGNKLTKTRGGAEEKEGQKVGKAGEGHFFMWFIRIWTPSFSLFLCNISPSSIAVAIKWISKIPELHRYHYQEISGCWKQNQRMMLSRSPQLDFCTLVNNRLMIFLMHKCDFSVLILAFQRKLS